MAIRAAPSGFRGRQGHRGVDGGDGRLSRHPRVAAKVELEDLLGGPRREGLDGQRGIRTTEAIRERRPVRYEQPLDPSGLGVFIQDRIARAQAHPQKATKKQNPPRHTAPQRALPVAQDQLVRGS